MDPRGALAQPRVALALAFALSASAALLLFWPAAIAPVGADDRYWYMWIAHEAKGSLLELVRWSASLVPEELQGRGRIAQLAYFERRLLGMPLIEASVATGVPVVVYQAAQKVLLLVAAGLSCLAMLRSLRWRTASGDLVRAGRGTFLLAGVATPIALAAGTQTHNQFRNSWTSYSVLTYGAVVAIFGSIAALIWMTRLIAERRRWVTVPAVLLLVVIALATNASYEVIYPGVVVAAVAWLVVPVTARADAAAGRRAKIITGIAYFVTFTVGFFASRAYISAQCPEQNCYVGVVPNPGIDALRSFYFNLRGAVPGSAIGVIESDLEAVGWLDRWPTTVTVTSALLAAVVGAAMVLAWWGVRHSTTPGPSGTPATPDGAERQDAEGRLLLVGAGLSVLVALGVAAVMAISVQAQEIVTRIGLLYRGTMATWTALAFAAVLLVIAVGHLSRGRLGSVAWGTLAVCLATMAATLWPQTALLTAAATVRPSQQASDAVLRELAIGDLGRSADARRCALIDTLPSAVPGRLAVRLITVHAQQAFQHYHGVPFCSTAPIPD